MSDITSNIFTNSQVFPKYVSDETLKRARVDTADGPSIRIAGTFSGSSTDLTSVTDTLGTTSDTSSDATMIGLTKLGNSYLNGINTSTSSVDTKVGNIGTDVGDIKTGITSITSDVGTIQTDVDSINTKTGTIETLLGNNIGNISLHTSNIASDTGYIRTNTASSSTTLGSKSDAAWDGITANPSVISLLKGIVNKL